MSGVGKKKKGEESSPTSAPALPYLFPQGSKEEKGTGRSPVPTQRGGGSKSSTPLLTSIPGKRSIRGPTEEKEKERVYQKKVLIRSFILRP